LTGKQFDLVQHYFVFTESYVFFHDEDGLLREIPAAWTDFVAGDVFVQEAAGRSPLHAGTLLELADLVGRMAHALPTLCQANDVADVMAITPSQPCGSGAFLIGNDDK
jgi:hypothetical protein